MHILAVVHQKVQFLFLFWLITYRDGLPVFRRLPIDQRVTTKPNRRLKSLQRILKSFNVSSQNISIFQFVASVLCRTYC